MNDRELLAGFQASQLNVFPHEDHLRVAYLLVREHGLLVREHGEVEGAQQFVRSGTRLRPFSDLGG